MDGTLIKISYYSFSRIKNQKLDIMINQVDDNILPKCKFFQLEKIKGSYHLKYYYSNSNWTPVGFVEPIFTTSSVTWAFYVMSLFLNKYPEAHFVNTCGLEYNVFYTMYDYKPFHLWDKKDFLMYKLSVDADKII